MSVGCLCNVRPAGPVSYVNFEFGATFRYCAAPCDGLSVFGPVPGGLEW